MTTKNNKRFVEIDILRGVAVILMVIFHIGYNLNFFGVMDLNMTGGYWRVMAKIVQYIFVITTGLTLYISYHRNSKKRLYHTAKLFFWAMVITLVTWLLYDDQAVKFGILHFYSLAILLGLFFVNTRMLALIMGLGIIYITPSIVSNTANFSFLFPIGITQIDFQSLDYFPLFPWFGWFLLGVSLGGFAYPLGSSKLNITLHGTGFFGGSLRYLGQHSLFIYLTHQPIIASLIFFYKQIFY